MTPQKKRGPKNKPKNSPPPTPTPKGGDVDGEPNTQPKANDCRYVKQEPPDIYVNIPPAEKEKRWQWNLANKIAALMVFVTIVYTVFTYLLFRKAAVQSDQTIRAANSADSVFVETKKEFNLINRPIVQVLGDSTKPKTMVVGERFEIGYMLDNLKDITTKVISTQSQFLFDTVIRNLDSFKAVLISDVDTKTPNVNQFVTKEKPIQASAISPDTLTMGEAMYLLGDNHPLFMMTAIKYENLVTKEPVFGFIALKLTWHRNGRGLTEVVRNDVD